MFIDSYDINSNRSFWEYLLAPFIHLSRWHLINNITSFGILLISFQQLISLYLLTKCYIIGVISVVLLEKFADIKCFGFSGVIYAMFAHFYYHYESPIISILPGNPIPIYQVFYFDTAYHFGVFLSCIYYRHTKTTLICHLVPFTIGYLLSLSLALSLALL